MAKPKIRFLYTGIRVRDLERSLRFYRALGMRVLFRGKMDHGGEFVHLALPRSIVRLELNYYPEGNPYYTPWGPGAEFDHLGFIADDADRWIARLKKAGATEALPTWTESTSRIGYVNDPDGVTIEVFSPLKRPRKAPRRRTPSARRRRTARR
ncbi:MAG TPA: VOC family protein [Thermoplasmata archaeon]|nr:VOC family protein [Thermoplasmata archaeon]